MQTKPDSCEVHPGERIDRAAERAVNLAKRHHRPIKLVFNGTELTAWPDSTPQELVSVYWALRQR